MDPDCVTHTWLADCPIAGQTPLKPKAPVKLGGGTHGTMQAADINITFARPKGNATFGVNLLGVATAYIEFVEGSPSVRVGIYDGAPRYPSPPTPPLNGSAPLRVDMLRLLPTDDALNLRAFTDLGVLEVYWMDGRVVITSPFKEPKPGRGVELFASADGLQLEEATAWAMDSIWVSPEEVLATPRIDQQGGNKR
jgi:hypothetical protein